MRAEVIDRLKAQLLISGIQQKNQALFQVINLLIDAARDTASDVQGSSGGGGGVGVLPQSFLTTGLEQGTLANSRQIRPGSGVTIMDNGVHLLVGASPIPMFGECEESEAYIPLPGPQGPIGPTGPAGAGVSSAIMLPPEFNIPEEIIPVPLVFDPLNLDYSIRGTWTPTIVSSGGGAGAYDTQNGTWIKEKNKVTGSFLIDMNSLGTLAAGDLSISGLPFTAGSSNGIPFLCIFASLGVAQIYVYNVVNPSTTSLLLRKQTAAATSNATNLTLADITANFVVAGGFTYFL